MKSLEKPLIYTIGHSTHCLEEFLNMLKAFNIEVLADVRRFAGSKRYPWFSKENLEKYVAENNIEYIHFEALGGRRKFSPILSIADGETNLFVGMRIICKRQNLPKLLKNSRALR
jgi:uncharacterized protein (DUF488 family)